MGDMGDVWRDVREYRREKKESNRINSIDLLIENKIEFVIKNNGTHIVCNDFDYWPSTGLFINRISKKRGRGIKNLIRKLKG